MYISDMKRWLPEARITLNSGAVFVFEPDWSWRVRNLPDLDLWYLTDGKGWIADGRTRTPIGADDCLLLRPGHSYDAGHDPRRPLSLFAFHFDVQRKNEKRLILSTDEMPPFVRRMAAGSFFRELLSRALRAHQDGCRKWARAWFQAALMEVIRQDVTTWPPGPLGDQARQIEGMCERIRRRPGKPVNVEELASQMHVSPGHFCRMFRRLQGKAPRAFISRTRIEAAQSLLLASSHSVARIAELLGYESPFYFSRQFKSKVGLSPSEFRNRRPDLKHRLA